MSLIIDLVEFNEESGWSYSTALSITSESENNEMAKMLIRKGSDLLHVNRNTGYSYFFFVLCTGNISRINYCLKILKKNMTPEDLKETVLGAAASTGNLSVIRHFYEFYGKKWNLNKFIAKSGIQFKKLLSDAAGSGRYKDFKYLMKFKDAYSSKYLYKKMLDAAGGSTRSNCRIVKELSSQFNERPGHSELICRAIHFGHILMVKTLIQCKFEFLKCYNKEFPVGMAAKKGDLRIMKLLIEAAWEDFTTTLGSGETFLEYFEKRSNLFDENQPFQSDELDDTWFCRKNYPLFLAIKKGHLSMVKYLVSRGFDVNARASIDHTPLMVATSNNQIEIVKLLLQTGADIDAQTTYNVTSLNIAALEGNKEMFDLLLNSGATVFFPEEDSSDLLTHAIDGRNEEIVIEILHLGVDPNFVKFRKETPLSYAVRRNLTRTAMLLVDAGATAKIEDLREACSQGNLETIVLLIEAGAIIDSSCLEKVIKCKNLNALKYVVSNGGSELFTEREALSTMIEKVKDDETRAYLRSLQLMLKS